MSTWRPLPPPAPWQRRLPRAFHAPTRWLARLAAGAVLAATGLATVYFLLAQRFDVEAVARLPESPIFYDRRGLELQAPGLGGRQLVRRDELPAFLVDALCAREDARFFDHGGVDARGMLRAMQRNLRDRRFTQGASTLSMQLARNTFHIREKSLHRKLLEVALTWRLEARFTKDEILTHYLNRIYFGSGAEGIEQAAQTYFGKTTSALSDSESALIVGIIRAPHAFSPWRDLPAALAQREQTLDRLVAMGKIGRDRRDQLAAETVNRPATPGRGRQTSYALQAVSRELDRLLETIRLEPGGLRVHTTLDAGWQNRLEQELARAVQELEGEPSWPHPTRATHPAGEPPHYLQFAAITTETATGATLALIGGRHFDHSRFDRTRSSRDLGPAFEPFVAAAAAEAGRPVLPGQPVQTGRPVGPAAVARMARRCGLAGPFFDTEDLFRGSAAASPAEMAAGLAALGNGGRRPRHHLIREIRDAAGTLVYRTSPRLVPTITPRAATEALRVLKPSGNTRNLTGATGSQRDAWALRLGPQGATAIWIGFDQPALIAPAPRLQSLLQTMVQRLENR